MSSAMDILDDDFALVSLEVLVVFIFVFGFAVVRHVRLCIRKDKGAFASAELLESAQASADDQRSEGRAALFAVVEAEAAAGHAGAALDLWRKVKLLRPTPVETLRFVVHAFLTHERHLLVEEIAQHFEMHEELACPAIAAVVLDVIGRAGHVEPMEAMYCVFTERLRIPSTPQMTESVLGGYVFAGVEGETLAEFMARVRAGGQKITARGHSLMLRGLLKIGSLDAAFSQAHQMQCEGCILPPFAISEFVRVACSQGRAAELLKMTFLPLSAEAIALLFEHCLSRNDLVLATQVERFAVEACVPLCPRAAVAWLKLLAGACDHRASEVFKDMQLGGAKFGESQCISLLGYCAKAKSFSFAEEVARYARANAKLSIAFYSSLMKFYFNSGHYDQICDLNDEALAAGLQPDSWMQNCVLGCAIECGRS